MERAIEKLIYYRLIALWILCEAMLGGILHGFKIPVTGLIVGSSAVVCISLIAYYTSSKGSILKATLIVAIFKMMLSPQAPLTAYFAVFFQGLMGEALFWNRKMYAFSCFLLGVVVLLESGLQRIIILTIVYGKDLWNAINIYINGITGQTILTNYSFFLIAAYIVLHLIVGISIGLGIGRLPHKIQLWTEIHKNYLFTLPKKNVKTEILFPAVKRKRKFLKSFVIIWCVLLLFYFQTFTPQIYVKIFIRSLLILLICYFIIGPILTLLLTQWLQKKQIKEYAHIQKILQMLPDTKQLVIKSWQLSAIKKGIHRIWLCSKIILVNTFYTLDNEVPSD